METIAISDDNKLIKRCRTDPFDCRSTNWTWTAIHDNNVEMSDSECSKIISKVVCGTEKLKSSARQRWRILAKAIHHQQNESDQLVIDTSNIINLSAFIRHFKHSSELAFINTSVRRFGSFDLIECRPLFQKDENNNQIHPLSEFILKDQENWFQYTIRLDSDTYALNIHHVPNQVSVKDLMGFNNTGNICVWPSEEALSAFILDNKDLFSNKKVLELGGGMTCLAGLLIAKYCHPDLVYLTDGNEKCVENVQSILKHNSFENGSILKVESLKWQDVALKSPTLNNREEFDVILSADCLFFDETRDSLLETISFYLSDFGKAFVIAPKRGNTFQRFLDSCLEKGFHTEVLHRYNDHIWQKYLQLKQLNFYNEDIHYPILLILSKIPTAQNLSFL